MCLGGDKGAGAGRMSVLCVLLCWTSTCVSHRGADGCCHDGRDAAFRGAATAPLITASLSGCADATQK